MSEDAFIKLTIADINREQLLSLFETPDIPTATLQLLHQHQQAGYEATLYRVKPDAMSIPAPSADDLKKFYESRQAQYMSPEFRSFRYLTWSLDDMKRNVTISDDELAAAYEKDKAQFQQPAQRAFHVLVFNTPAAAAANADKVKAAGSLAAGAALVTRDAQLIRNPLIPVDDILPDLRDTVSSAPLKQIVGPVQSNLGMVMVEVVEDKPAHTPPLQQIATSLRQQLIEQRAADELYDILGKVDEQVAAGADLDALAATFERPLTKVEPLDAAGFDKVNKQKNINRMELVKAAYGTAVGQVSNIGSFAGDDGHYFVLQVDQVVEAKPLPLADIETRVQREWRLDQQQQRAASMASDLLAQAQTAGLKANQVSTAVEVTPLPRISRANIKGVEPAIAQVVLGLVKAGAAQPVDTGRGPGFVVLTQKIAANQPTDSELAALKADAQQQWQNWLLLSALNYYQQHYGLRIDQQQLDAVLGTDTPTE